MTRIVVILGLLLAWLVTACATPHQHHPDNHRRNKPWWSGHCSQPMPDWHDCSCHRTE